MSSKLTLMRKRSLISFLSPNEFNRCVARYDGNKSVRAFSCWDQFLTLAFAQLKTVVSTARAKARAWSTEASASAICRRAAARFVQQVGVLHHEFADRVDIVAPDRVDEFARVDEPRPAWYLIAASECELRIGKPGLIGRDGFRVMLSKFLDRGWIAAPDVAEQIPGLMLELIEVGTDGKFTILTVFLVGHDEPPLVMPAVRSVRAKGGSHRNL